MLLTYIFLLGFFISTAVCEEESQALQSNEQGQGDGDTVEESAHTTTVATTTAATNTRAKRSAPPQQPTKGGAKTKGPGLKAAGFAKKLAAKVKKGGTQALKKTKAAAKTVSKKVAKKKK
ncbi:hypothetical protein TTRE_0000893301 [Trichuris trichiura]|uniref:Uncharacterized protein n=1 Tax=Trichuris trichiura TaxID=36087 RepID=A0A077ZJF9_TRITR|nr:hypothetical protein TTRE_0000893301 [Trichuris trichiura]